MAHTDEQARDLHSRIMAGDVAARHEALNSQIRWVTKCVARYRPRDLDDAIQDAMVHIIERLERWDPSRGSLTNFVFWQTRQAMSRHHDAERARRYGGRRKIVRTSELRSEYGPGENSLPSRQPGPFELACRHEDITRVRAAILLLPTPERVVIVRRANDELLTDIGSSLGIGRRRAGHIAQRATERLRTVLKG